MDSWKNTNYEIIQALRLIVFQDRVRLALQIEHEKHVRLGLFGIFELIFLFRPLPMEGIINSYSIETHILFLSPSLQATTTCPCTQRSTAPTGPGCKPRGEEEGWRIGRRWIGWWGWTTMRTTTQNTSWFVVKNNKVVSQKKKRFSSEMK